MSTLDGSFLSMFRFFRLSSILQFFLGLFLCAAPSIVVPSLLHVKEVRKLAFVATHGVINYSGYFT